MNEHKTPPNWPLVDPNDDGIRPAGRKNECFYCQQRVGRPHGAECVIVTKAIELAVTATMLDGTVFTGSWLLDEPHYKDAASIEFRYNESSWCADNFLHAQTPAGYMPAGDEDEGYYNEGYGTVTWNKSEVDPWQALEASLRSDTHCLCKLLSFRFVRVVDDTPKRKLKMPFKRPVLN